MGANQQFSLRWNNYLRHITCAFDTLRNDDNLVDVTLSCEGKKIRAHKMLLSACSSYFQDLFKENPCQHPVVIFRNVKFEDLSALVDFMYQGEVNVGQDQLSSFLATAELLAIQGLSEGNGSDKNVEQKESEGPVSPSLPTEPKVQLGKNSTTHKLLPSSGRSSDVISPVSFPCVDRPCDSSPKTKRRKLGSGTSSSNGPSVAERDGGTSDLERRRTSSNNAPANTIHFPNLKLELPDYEDEDPEGSSCSYGDSNQGAGPGGTYPHPSTRGDPSSPDLQDSLDMYDPDSADDAKQHATDMLPAPDISQLLAKPGTSGENQSQDSLHVSSQHGNGGVTKERKTTPMKMTLGFKCNMCDKEFKHTSSLNKHRQVHSGKTTCPICYKVLNRMIALKKHMLTRHSHQFQSQVSSQDDFYTI